MTQRPPPPAVPLLLPPPAAAPTAGPVASGNAYGSAFFTIGSIMYDMNRTREETFDLIPKTRTTLLWTPEDLASRSVKVPVYDVSTTGGTRPPPRIMPKQRLLLPAPPAVPPPPKRSQYTLHNVE